MQHGVAVLEDGDEGLCPVQSIGRGAHAFALLVAGNLAIAALAVAVLLGAGAHQAGAAVVIEAAADLAAGRLQLAGGHLLADREGGGRRYCATQEDAEQDENT